MRRVSLRAVARERSGRSDHGAQRRSRPGGERVRLSLHAREPGSGPCRGHGGNGGQAALASGIFDPYIAQLRQDGNEVPATQEEILAKLLDDEDGQHENWGTWSSSSGDFVEWSTEEPFGEITDEYDRNQSLGRLHMSEVLRQNLEEVTLIYLFDVEVKLLIVGRTSCGQLAGYLTTLIWT